MKNKNVLFVFLIIAVVGVGIYFFSQSTPNAKAQGRVVFGITDAAEDMRDVSSILITVDKVEIHNINGWVEVSNEVKQYDLLVLKKSGAVALLTSANIDAGTYDQVRLMVSKVIVIKNGVEIEAKLPSSELKIVGNIIVNTDKTSSVVFDFLADQSLHMTGNGKLIFAPVIKISKYNNVNIELKSNNEIVIKDGEKEDDEDVGMDEKGEFKNNFRLEGKFEIGEDDDIKDDDDDDNDQDDDDNGSEIKTED
ncbi:MAG: DUF4382 domain-containing protein [Candidatus Paceibacterota bacterium]|jgi:hypothetical protein